MPHRVVLSMLSAAMACDALLRPVGHGWTWGVAALTAGAALPAPSSRSWAQAVCSEVRYFTRRRVRWLVLEPEGVVLHVGARGMRRVWCYEMQHLGRLDLSGRDLTLAHRLGGMIESLAASGERAHVSLHVESSRDVTPRTVLSVDVGAPPPPEWRPDPCAGVPRSVHAGRVALIERREYVRTPHCVLRVLRVTRFSADREIAALETLSDLVSWLTLSWHVAVIPAPRARRLSERAVHRRRSDAQVSRGAGFRWSARHEQDLEALRRRESAVAAGAALCQWALYLVVRASTLEQLRRRVARTLEQAKAGGLGVDLGTGVQGEWFIYQLPGGPGW
jgi:hypothetical protein